ncbi:MAG: substrate-binding domain-containing protein [Actinomycetota bacterium]
MHTFRSFPSRLLLLVLAVALIATACGGSDESSDTATSSETASTSESSGTVDADGSLTGEFLISGSSTVFPIMNKQAEEFGAANPGVAIAVEGPGSGDGAKLFCSGEIPIGNASRQYKDEELADCEANGIEFIELRRAIDGISVVTSAENDAIDCLSFDQLYALISDEAIGFTSWSDANDLLTDMGSTAGELPDAPLDVFAPGQESGTYDSFAEIVIEGVAKGKTGLDTESREFFEQVRLDYNSSPDDNIIIEGISGNQFSLGWVGFAFASEAAEAGDAKLVDVSKDADGECVTPTPETIAAADFPISRFLYTYINADMAADNPAVEAFVDYMMSDAGLESVSAVGYIDLSADDQTKAQDLWANRTTGIQW